MVWLWAGHSALLLHKVDAWKVCWGCLGCADCICCIHPHPFSPTPVPFFYFLFPSLPSLPALSVAPTLLSCRVGAAVVTVPFLLQKPKPQTILDLRVEVYLVCSPRSFQTSRSSFRTKTPTDRQRPTLLNALAFQSPKQHNTHRHQHSQP